MLQEKQRFTEVPKPAACPPPDQGPVEMILWRIGKLEESVETLIGAMHKQNGAFSALKLLGAFLVGAVVVLAFVLDRMA